MSQIGRFQGATSKPFDESDLASTIGRVETFLIPATATVPDTATDPAHVFMFPGTHYSSAKLLGASLNAPEDLQDSGEPSGTTTIQFDTDPAFGDPVSISLESNEFTKSATFEVDIDIGDGEVVYARVSAAGGHSWVTVKAEFQITA